MKRKWLQMFAFVMVVIGACMFVPEAKEAKATTTGVPASSITWGAIPATQEDDVIFAGWYADEEYKTPLKTKPAGDGLCYAKWVDADILSIKMQASEDKTKLRLVSSVDTLDYRNVGFEIYFTPEGQTERKTTFEAFTVLKRINAVNTGVTYAYSPKIISADSEYFVTATMTEIASKNLERDFYIRPYWTTCDGTKVYGVSRMFAINDCLDGGMINVTIKDDTSTVLNANDSVNVTLGTGTTETVTASVVGKRNGYVHLNVAKARTELDSTTKVTYNGEPTIYQNLLSKSTTDTSWYDADPDADKYVITTKADLMGIQAKGLNFANKEIYLVADMENVGQWTPIDTMAGTFDGQGHTISGFDNEGSAIYGMFKAVTGKVGNFTLSDSVIRTNNYSGSIVGTLSGELYDVHVDESVTVIHWIKKYVAGLVGQVVAGGNKAIIRNCSFAGKVQVSSVGGEPTGGTHAGILATIKNADCEIVNCVMSGSVEKGWNVGGLVGEVEVGCNVTLRNCLVTGTVSSIRSGNTYVDLLIGTNRSNLYVEDVYSAGTNKGLVDQNNTTIGDAKKESQMDGIAYCWSSSYIYGLTEVITPADITGSNAWNKLNLDFYSKHNEDGVWVAIDGGVPKLKIAVADTDKILEEDYTGTTPRFGWYNLHTKKTSGRTTATEDIDPVAGTVFQIETVGDMYGFRQQMNSNVLFEGHTIELCNDLVFNPNWDGNIQNVTGLNNWDGLSSNTFKGTFDGKNHTLSKIYQSRTADSSTGSHGGLFRKVNGTIQNLKISDSIFNGGFQNMAAVVGEFSGTMKNVHCDDGVTVSGFDATYNVGGLVGYITNSAYIHDSSFAGTVTGGRNNRGTGGLVGTIHEVNDGTCEIKDCSFTGTVRDEYMVGGIVGFLRATTGKQLDVVVENCVVSGTIDNAGSGTTQWGSVCGRLEPNTKITLTNVDTSSCNRTTRCASAEGTVVDNDAAATAE